MAIRELASYFGRGAVLLSFIFLAYLVTKLDFTRVVERYDTSWIVKFILFSLIFSLSYFFLAYSWKRLLEMLSKKPFKRDVFSAYLTSVIFKYLPGNVFHFLGRHALIDKEHTTHKNILLSNTLEVFIMLFSALLLLFVGTFFVNFSFSLFGFEIANSVLVALFLSMIATVGAILYFGRGRFGLKKHFDPGTILLVLLYHTIFLLISASLFVFVFKLFLSVEMDTTQFFEMLFIALIAWLFGFVLPGAPGGLGVRESIYILLIPGMAGIREELVLAAAIIYRLITIAGEALTYLWAKLLKEEGKDAD